MVVRFLFARQWMPRGRQLDVKFAIANERWKFLTLSFCVEKCFFEGQSGVVLRAGGSRKLAILLGFLRQNVPEFEQNRKKPEKTCGNRRIPIDKALGKDEGELR